MSYENYRTALQFGNVSDSISALKQKTLNKLDNPLDQKQLDISSQINDLTSKKEEDDSLEGIIGSALGTSGGTTESMALMKKLYGLAKQNISKVADKAKDLKNAAQDKLNNLENTNQPELPQTTQSQEIEMQNMGSQDLTPEAGNFGKNISGQLDESQMSPFLKSSQQSEVNQAGGADTDLKSTEDIVTKSGEDAGEEAAETGAETATDIGEAGASAAAETGIEAGVTAATEAVGAGLDATGILAPIGVLLQLGGLAAGIYQGVKDGQDDSQINLKEDLENQAKQSEDKMKSLVNDQTFSGFSVAPGLTSTVSQGVTTTSF